MTYTGIALWFVLGILAAALTHVFRKRGRKYPTHHEMLIDDRHQANMETYHARVPLYNLADERAKFYAEAEISPDYLKGELAAVSSTEGLRATY